MARQWMSSTPSVVSRPTVKCVRKKESSAIEETVPVTALAIRARPVSTTKTRKMRVMKVLAGGHRSGDDEEARKTQALQGAPSPGAGRGGGDGTSPVF